MCFKPSLLNTLHNYQRILIRSEVLNYTLCSRPELNMQTVHENGDRFKLFMCTLRMCKGGWQSGAWVFDFVPADKFFVYSQKNLKFRRVFVFCWSEDDFYIQYVTGDFDFFLIVYPWPLFFFGSEHQGDNMSIFQRLCSTMFLFLNTCLIFKKF